MSKKKTTTGALGTTGTNTQVNHKKKCDGCKRAEGVKPPHVYTCNCNVAQIEE